jgi:carboxylesterase type B
MNALKFLSTVAPAIGGDKSKITIAGQSSGANMIRALLAAPSADSLFKSAILQSDPMNYGFLSTDVQSKLVDHFNNKIGCSGTDSSCLNSLSLSTILDAQSDLMDSAMDIDESVGIAQPIRVVKDGSLITSPLDSTGNFPSVSKPILITTVTNEAGPSIYSPSMFPDPLQSFMFGAVTEANLGDDRAQIVENSGFYNVTALSDGSFDARVQLEELGTDYIWKCSSWTFARNWVQHGGNAYVGMFTVGKTYPANDGVPYCTGGKVCHQDDIEIVVSLFLKVLFLCLSDWSLSTF